MSGFLGAPWFKFASRAKNKVVLITGTNEIATLAATHFALAGAKVVIGDANEPEGERISQLIRESSETVSFLRTDVTIWEHQLLLFKFAVEKHGHIDIVLPLALLQHDTTGFDAPFDETADAPPQPDLSTLKVNQDGFLFTTKLALYYLSRSDATPRALVFLNIDAAAGKLPHGPALSATKFGMIGLQRCLVITAPSGIRICTVVNPAPPGTGTNDIDKSAPDARLIAQAIFLATTDPSPSTRDAAYLASAVPKSGGVPVKCIPNSSLSISTVDPYKSMMRRFGIIIMITNFLKALIFHIHSLFRLY